MKKNFTKEDKQNIATIYHRALARVAEHKKTMTIEDAILTTDLEARVEKYFREKGVGV